ncbi:MAG: hypothetical protein WBG08_00515, partial [Litorimonas sp.]
MFRSSLIFSALLAIAAPFAASAQSLVPLPPQSQDTPWPTEAWPTGDPDPAEAEALQTRLAGVLDLGVREGIGETRALILVKDGRIVFEHYRDGIVPETRHVSWSVAKSLTTTLVGRAVQLGLIGSIDAPMPAAFEPGDPRRDISWRDWLQLRDGLDYAEYGVADMAENDVVQMSFGPGRFDQLAHARENFA